MNFKYRGVAYDSQISTIKVSQIQSTGKYRGQSYQLSKPESTVKKLDDSITNNSFMTYRGVTYNHPESSSYLQNCTLINYA